MIVIVTDSIHMFFKQNTSLMMASLWLGEFLLVLRVNSYHLFYGMFTVHFNKIENN